jgi:hypothetical protein
MTKSHRVDSFGAILSGLAKRLGLESRLAEVRVQREWREMIGEPIASHAWPVQIRFKKLYLVVENSVWLHQLTFLKPVLLEKLQAAIGPDRITEIMMRVGDVPAQAPPPDSGAGTARPPTVSEPVLTEAAAHAVAVRDPELRARLIRVMAEALSRSGNYRRAAAESLNNCRE